MMTPALYLKRWGIRSTSAYFIMDKSSSTIWVEENNYIPCKWETILQFITLRIYFEKIIITYHAICYKYINSHQQQYPIKRYWKEDINTIYLPYDGRAISWWWRQILSVVWKLNRPYLMLMISQYLNKDKRIDIQVTNWKQTGSLGQPSFASHIKKLLQFWSLLLIVCHIWINITIPRVYISDIDRGTIHKAASEREQEHLTS